MRHKEKNDLLKHCLRQLHCVVRMVKMNQLRAYKKSDGQLNILWRRTGFYDPDIAMFYGFCNQLENTSDYDKVNIVKISNDDIFPSYDIDIAARLIILPFLKHIEKLSGNRTLETILNFNAACFTDSVTDRINACFMARYLSPRFLIENMNCQGEALVYLLSRLSLDLQPARENTTKKEFRPLTFLEREKLRGFCWG